jgi:hypothetical protein
MRVRPLVFASAILIAAALVATPAQASTATWKHVPTPQRGGVEELSSVTALSPTDVWAVGTHIGSINGVPSPALIEHNTGSGWKIVNGPDVGPTGASLHAVDAASSHDIWAVGNAGPESLALHYDGTKWRVVPTPTAANGGGRLLAVAGLSSANAWAVGVGAGTGDGPATLIEHWNGHSWSVVPSPNQAPTDYNELRAVAAVSANDIWAVGNRSDDFNQPLAEHWDGHTWSVVPVPDVPREPTDEWGAGLRDVTAVSAHDVWAVGEAGLSYHWDGHSWKIIPVPRNAADADGHGISINSISARSSHDAWAVGYGFGGALTMRWNGTAWKLVSSPDASESTLNSVIVDCAGTTAVGSESSPSSDMISFALRTSA